MTKRTEMTHRVAEAKAKLMTTIANRAFTRKTTGLDGLAKRLVMGAPAKPKK
jgi:hypothetical protein